LITGCSRGYEVAEVERAVTSVNGVHKKTLVIVAL